MKLFIREQIISRMPKAKEIVTKNIDNKAMKTLNPLKTQQFGIRSMKSYLKTDQKVS
jgi:hypothetical protein